MTRLSARSVDQGRRTAKSEIADEDILLSRKTLGDFRLIRQIGYGGMGVVYEAEQLSLARKVAVKILPFASMLNQQHRRRFHNEALAAATLDHPNIVPVYFVGEDRGVHFYAMHLIEGHSIAELIAEMRGEKTLATGSKPSGLSHSDLPDVSRRSAIKSPRAHKTETVADYHSAVSTQRSNHPENYFLTVARLGAEAAEGLDHAHQVGILHRDIKPGNLMVDNAGKLWITDFGLASMEHGESLTRTGGVVGTAAYMSPEQAADSHHVDNRSDVYSLGATLYEMLTLRKHRSDDETVVESTSGANRAVMSFNSFGKKIPVDLETIVLKSLSYDPADRYNTALEMANDLRSYIMGREIKARRLTLAQRLGRFLRRHRRLTTAATILSFLVIASFGTIMWVYSRQLSVYARQLEHALTDAQESHIEAEAQARKARQQLERAERSERSARQMSYRTDTQSAFDSFARHNLVDASRSLARQIPTADATDLRCVAWRLLNAQVNAKLIALGSHDGRATECVLYPDGVTVATAGDDGLIHLWDIDKRKKRKSFDPKIGPIHAMAISPDGKTLAVGGSPKHSIVPVAKIHLMKADTGEKIGRIQRHKTTIESICFSPDGNLIAAGSRYQKVELSTIDGKQRHEFPNDERNESIAFSPDSKFLATLWQKKDQLHIWDCSTGLDAVEPISCIRSVASFQWLPDGRCIAVSGKSGPWVNIYDVETGVTLATLSIGEPKPSSVQSLAIASDGQSIMAGDTDGKLHQWKSSPEVWRAFAATEGTHAVVEPVIDAVTVDHDGVTSMVRMADGSIVTAHESGSVRLSNPDHTAVQFYPLDFDTTAAVAISDQSIFLASSRGSIHRFDIESKRLQEVWPASQPGVVNLAVTSDGTHLAVVYGSSRVDLINLATGMVQWTQAGAFQDDDPVFQVGLSPNGHYLARSGDDKRLVMWNTDQQQPIFRKQFPGVSWTIAFSRDGRLVAHGQEEIHVFEVETGDLIHRFRGASVEDLQFGRDHQCLAGGHRDGSIRLFDLNTGAERILRGRAREIRSIAFSDDSQTIIGAEFNRDQEAIQLWDIASGEAYGQIANPLPRDGRGYHSTSKIFAIGKSVIACPTNMQNAQIAIWDLPK